MQIQKDSSSFIRAGEKSYRLLPEMFKTRIIWRFGSPIVTRRVVGSRGFVYTVRIWNEQISSFNAVCDCAAGQKDMVCYHVAAVFNDYQALKVNQELWNLSLMPKIWASSYVM